MFNLFLAFLVLRVLSLPWVSSLDVLVLMEYLSKSGMSLDHITSHITAVRSLCIVYGYTLPFRDQRIPLFIKSLKLTRSFIPKIPIVMYETLLLQIVTLTAQLQCLLIYKALYLHFSLSSDCQMYCHSLLIVFIKHLCAGDVIFCHHRSYYFISVRPFRTV